MTTDLQRADLRRDFAAAKTGDQAAYGRLIQATQRMVIGIALAHTRDGPLSQDIAQETYLRGWMHLSDIDQAESLLPWLRQVARNLAIDRYRARHRESAMSAVEGPLAGQQDEPASPEQEALNAERSGWLREAMDQVPEGIREVLTLYYLEDQSSQQVAVSLGLSDTTVRKRLQRAREALGQQFLRRFAEASQHQRSGPQKALAPAVLIALGSAAPPLAKAATTATAAKVGGSLLVGATAVTAALGAAIGAVFVGIYIELREPFQKLRTPRSRQAMGVNAIAYAALMTAYILGLQQMKQAGWSEGAVIWTAILVSALLVGLAFHRIWLVRQAEILPPSG